MASSDIKKIMLALKDLGEAVKALPRAVLDCKGTISDVRHLIAAIESITNPISFAYHVGRDLFVNSINIYKNTR